MKNLSLLKSFLGTQLLVAVSALLILALGLWTTSSLLVVAGALLGFSRLFFTAARLEREEQAAKLSGLKTSAACAN